jgi:hypothetical protein
MKAIFLRPIAVIVLSIMAFLLFGCGNSNDSDNSEKTTTSSPIETATTASEQNEIAIQNPAAGNRVEKTYDGQTILMLDMGNFPLKDEPL